MYRYKGSAFIFHLLFYNYYNSSINAKSLQFMLFKFNISRVMM